MAKRMPAGAAHGKKTARAASAADESPQKLRHRVRRIVQLLNQAYPGATCALHHRNPYELLVATILSAQCTDERVNMVTPELFRRFPDAQAMASAPREELERMIQSTGFYRAKAKNIQECCRQLVERHQGQVPPDMDALVALPGIGRKTANVVLGTAYGLPTGIVVDTHVARIAKRLGLTRQNDPNKIEQDLMALVPRQSWIDFSHQLIHHGRRICKARRPLCDQCPLEEVCPKVGVAAAPAQKTSPSASRKRSGTDPRA
ncbi:MAG: endonuclease III [Pirellulaceae bacterium]|nr:MAG: endonuclease III [Pirellulaceae bacterium]